PRPGRALGWGRPRDARHRGAGRSDSGGRDTRASAWGLRREAAAHRARRGRSCVEFLDESWEPRIIEPRLIGLIERGAVEKPGVALLELRADRLVGAGSREGLEH